jgi:soluble lytic murein transglycosylase-like protein
MELLLLGTATAVLLWYLLYAGRIPLTELYPIVMKYSNIYKVDPALVFAIIEQESGFRPKAYRMEERYWRQYILPNPKYKTNPFRLDKTAWGSWGLMQILYDTALQYGMPQNVHPKDWLTIPENNIKIGVQYLADLFQRYKELSDVIAHYNGGSYAVRQKILTGRYSNQDYVDSVLKRYSKWSKIFVKRS